MFLGKMPNKSVMEKGMIRKLQYVFILYVFLLFYFSTSSPSWLIMMQFFFALELIIVFTILCRVKPSQESIIIGILLLINSIVARSFFTQNGIHPFGPEPEDSIHYMTVSFKYVSLSAGQYMQNVMSKEDNMNIDDLGMAFIARWAALIGGSKAGYMGCLLLFNSIAIIISSRFVFKTAYLILSKSTSFWIMSLYGLHQGFIAFSVFGLKENFFLVFTVIAFYHIVRYIKLKATNDLLLVFLFVLLTCLFRLAVGAQLVMAFLICLFVGKARHLLGGGVILLFFTYVVLINLDQIIIMVGGQGLEAILSVGEASKSNLSIEQLYLLNFVYSIIGSPPMVNGEVGFNHITSFSYFIRALLSILMIWGAVVTIKKRNVLTLFFSLFGLLGVGMLTLSLRGSDFRFAAVYFPSLLFLAGYGYENLTPSRWYYVFSSTMIVVVLALTFIWNR